MSEQPEPKAPAAAAPKAKPAKKTWSNPALRAMGIPRISLPSRNWMIFWTVLASIGGGIYYDKHQQKKIREKYMKQVEHLSQIPYPADRLPRRLLIFIAPPPDDFLDESLSHFRKYVKPILNAAAIDYEVYTETRQGDIRAEVAERIRELRRLKIQLEDTVAPKDSKAWRNYLPALRNPFKKVEEPEVFVSRHELYSPTDVIGLYRLTSEVTPVRDDALDPAGGVLCIGRGTYKEYMAGVHEGLLGPLEKPAVVLDTKSDEVTSGEQLHEGTTIPEHLPTAEGEDAKEVKNIGDFQHIDQAPPLPTTEEPTQSDFAQDENPTKKPEREPVPEPYIASEQYAAAPLAPELDFSSVIRNDKNVPVLFEQPVFVYPIMKVRGFLNLPRKIYGYFTRRYIAEQVAQDTIAVVDYHTRGFEYKDLMMGRAEEQLWPKKWVARGKEKNSEWVKDLVVDARVTDRMSVFDGSAKAEPLVEEPVN